MKTKAVKDGDHWVINGRKIWISRIAKADFTIVMAVTDSDLGARGGITAFLVDKGTPGLVVARAIPMLAGQRTYEVVFEDCRVHESQVLGRIGAGFAPMQLRLTVRRLQMGSWCIGMAQRALDMLVEHANQRVTFGQKLADRQAIQWWIADAATKLHACRLMVMDAAVKQDEGRDVRMEASMIKVFATEMATEVIDHAQQAFGAMGVTQELPLAVAGAEGAHHAGLRRPVRGAPHGDRAAHPGRPDVTAGGHHLHEECAMTYTLDAFVKDAKSALKANERSGRPREGARAAGEAADQPDVRRRSGRAGRADGHAQALRGQGSRLRRAGALQSQAAQEPAARPRLARGRSTARRSSTPT